MSNNKLFMEGHELAVLNRYYIWLLNDIDFDSHSNYSRLLEYLHNKNYVWEKWTDEDRAEDGLHLRIIFEDLTDYEDYSSLIRPCSVLEMLIAFASRINTDVMDDGYSTAHFFWIMLDNLGLMDCKDDNFDVEKVEKVLNSWLKPDNILTKKDLKSGIFTTKSGKKKFEDLDEWMKMQKWISENY